MTATMLPGSRSAAEPSPAPGRAVARLAVRQIRLGAAVVAMVCGGVSALAARQYRPISDLLDKPGLHALTENPAIRILSGPPVALDDPGGFTVWRTGPQLTLLASLWILLAATRITRGEEECRRSELLLSGRLRIADVVVRCLAALVGSATLIGVTVAAGLLASGTEPTGAVLYAAGMTCIALTFATAALLAAQVMPTRLGATGLTVAALGVSVLLRMIADSSHQLAWLAWATPFGLTARTAPYADNRIVPLIVLGAFPIALAGAALVAARRRDLGDGIVPVRGSSPPRTRFLKSVGAFAFRRSRRITLWWAIGIAIYFFLVGTTLEWLLELFQTNRRFAELAAAAGLGGHNLVNVIAGALFSLLAVPTGLYAAIRLAAMVADERAGRSTLLFAQPISRVRLMGTELVVTVGGVIALHWVAAFAVWAGTEITGAPLQLSDSLEGALNVVPAALLAAGAAAVGVGWLPSAAVAIGALPVLSGFLVNMVLQATKAPGWVANLSPWSHLASVPDAPPNWAGITIFLVLGATLTGFGLYGYGQRDLAA
jgi:polyether ionophore transport system permease protein